MATKIIYADPSWHPRFVKKDRLVVPNPIGVYRRSAPLTGYFEIYGLQLDAQSVCRYKVTYSLVPRSLRRPEGWFPARAPQQQPFVTASFIGEGGASELVEELANLASVTGQPCLRRSMGSVMVRPGKAAPSVR